MIGVDFFSSPAPITAFVFVAKATNATAYICNCV